ncbi:uncharacterized protein PAC_02412 [Phialocephala subalpina]|uniref:Uncharacterized protein n=1 Tax=Phialocephala subalpina TaxID=576137 RepID=A0A1L7WIE9_9HELO|nr:uncharacterized protein PAC_02412 [Phialocephala subalpina]
MSASGAENSSADSNSQQNSGDSTSQSNTSGAVQRGGAGMEKTGANPDAGDSSYGIKSSYVSSKLPEMFSLFVQEVRVKGRMMADERQNPADEPDFMKMRPGNAPGIMSQIREKLQEGSTRNE